MRKLAIILAATGWLGLGALSIVGPAMSDDPPSIGAPLRITGDQGQPLAQFQQGSAEGISFGTLYVNNGDIVGPRNIQCGSNFNPNCDIAAGSTAMPGQLNLNWDVGANTVIYDGHKNPLIRFNAKHHRIDLYVDLVLHNGAKIRKAR